MTGTPWDYYRDLSLGQRAGLRTSVVVTRDIFRVSAFNVTMDNYLSLSIRPSPAFRPFHTAKLCVVGLVVVLCMLIFKPFCTCSTMCDESQMNKASAVLFFFLLSCVALLKATMQTSSSQREGGKRSCEELSDVTFL